MKIADSVIEIKLSDYLTALNLLTPTAFNLYLYSICLGDKIITPNREEFKKIFGLGKEKFNKAKLELIENGYYKLEDGQLKFRMSLD